MWSVIDGLSGKPRETSTEVFSRFPAGFRRFPDNQSLMDHTVLQLMTDPEKEGVTSAPIHKFKDYLNYSSSLLVHD